MIGLTGSGKSTLGNCLLNNSGVLEKIKEKPFLTSNDSTGCTQLFQLEQNEEIIVIDTIGFGDPQFKQEFVLENLREALKKVDNKIDGVLYTVNQGRFTNQIVECFQIIQKEIFVDKFIKNSLLVVTGGNGEEWLKKTSQRDNEYVQGFLEMCNGLSYEFSLKFDDKDDDHDDLQRNVKKRQKSIDLLSKFLKEKNFKHIDFSVVQTPEFEVSWRKSYLKLIGIVGTILAIALPIFKFFTKV